MAIDTTHLKELSTALRILAADIVEKAYSGHPGMPLGFADVATTLFAKHLKFDPKNPRMVDRDRFVLSAGHGSALLYALNYLCGYDAFTLETLKHFRQLGSLAAGHPEHHPDAGIETTTGPLGQGFANAVGLALAEEICTARQKTYTPEQNISALSNSSPLNLVRPYTFCVVGDGCLMEGISQETLSFAGHQKLARLIVLFDDNAISIDGSTHLATSENHLKRFEAAGWHTLAIDGHDFEAIDQALTQAKQETTRPSFIACRTTIGKYAPTKAGSADVHGAPLGEHELKGLRHALKWSHPPFEIPKETLNLWRGLGITNDQTVSLTQDNTPDRGQDGALPQDNVTPQDQMPHFQEIDENSGIYKAFLGDLYDQVHQWIKDRPGLASRQSSGIVIELINKHFPQVIGGSADLSGSNSTKSKLAKAIVAENRDGNYIHYGVREHAMAAIMNGLALYDNFVPFGGTFLVFSDYARPAIRLSALMKQQVIYVLTHDSIGLGEDGPTHQPIEHLASLRAIPGLQVLRPSDSIEVAECWRLALKETKKPTVLALSRQRIPTVRSTYVYGENLSKCGGYIARQEKEYDERQAPSLTLVATGSEVNLAIDVQNLLEQEKLRVRVVSMPCVERFLAHPQSYREKTLGKNTPIFTIEAAATFGWERIATSARHCFGIDSFGASAPCHDLFEHFELTPSKIAEKIKAILAGEKRKKT